MQRIHLFMNHFSASVGPIGGCWRALRRRRRGQEHRPRRRTLTATVQPSASVADLKNFVNGEFVPAAAGRTSEVVDPSTGEAYALAPVSGPEDVDAALRSAEAAREALARRHPGAAQPGPAQDRRRGRGAGRRPGGGRVPEHRQARRPDPGRGAAAVRGRAPVLRRRRTPPAGERGGRVHGRAHLDDPARAGRRLRPGDALELPADDGDLEDRARRSPRATPWCSSPRTPPRCPP